MERRWLVCGCEKQHDGYRYVAMSKRGLDKQSSILASLWSDCSLYIFGVTFVMFITR